MQKYFIVKYDYSYFKCGTIVKIIVKTPCGTVLVENIETGERKWLMKYDIYPIINHDDYSEWSYNNINQKIIPPEYYIVKYEFIKIVKLLDNSSDNWSVLDLDTNKIITLNKNILIKANEI